jgi:hypothetical protein
LNRTEDDDHKVVPYAGWRIVAGKEIKKAAIVMNTIGSWGLYVAFVDNHYIQPV